MVIAVLSGVAPASGVSSMDFTEDRKLAEAQYGAEQAYRIEQWNDLKLRLEAAREYDIWTTHYKRYSFYWHFCTSVFIFFLVVGIMIFGMRLSYLQFTKEVMGARRKNTAEEPADEAETLPSTAASRMSWLKFGLQGVEVTSPVIGLAILTLSLVFFYLYLINVYPIFDQSLQYRVHSQANESRGK